MRLACRKEVGRGARRAGLGAASIVALGLGLSSVGCATNGTPGDPLEPMNRGIFWFNEQLDQWVLEPVATGYDWVAPERVQESVSNFFQNLRFPVVFVNDLLQGKLHEAGVEIGRFGVNTSIGILGLFDPAAHWGLKAGDEDFGQTLGRWGLGAGPYLVLPLLGPSNLRDAASLPVDSSLSVVPYLVDTPILLASRALQVVNLRARLLDEIRENRKMAFDYYVFVRDAWQDYRQNLVTDGEGGASDDTDDLYQVEP